VAVRTTEARIAESRGRRLFELGERVRGRGLRERGHGDATWTPTLVSYRIVEIKSSET
jgi:hypothetical protein